MEQQSFQNKIVANMNVKTAQTWLMQRKDFIKPWSEFVNSNNFKKPDTIKQWTTRSLKNIENYQANYMLVFIGLILYCIITSPLLLIAISAFLVMSYLISVRPTNIPLKVMGHEVTTTQQYSIAGLISFPLFFLAGTGSAVFWVLGVSFFLIGLHASFHLSVEEMNGEDQTPFVETV